MGAPIMPTSNEMTYEIRLILDWAPETSIVCYQERVKHPLKGGTWYYSHIYSPSAVVLRPLGFQGHMEGVEAATTTTT